MKISKLLFLGLAAFTFTACGNTVNTAGGQASVQKDQKTLRDDRVMSRIRFARTGGGALQFEVRPFGKNYRILRLDASASATADAASDQGLSEGGVAAIAATPLPKATQKLITLDPVADVLLVQGLDEVFKGNLRFVAVEPEAGQYGGTWTELKLYSKTAPVVILANPKPNGTGYDEFLINLENRVREDGVRSVTPGRVTRKQRAGCEGLTGESLVGIFEEKNEQVGCGWAGTVSTIKESSLIQPQVFHYQGVDETYAGGIVAQASKAEAVEYTFHLDTCVLEQTKNQVTSFAKIKRTRWSDQDLTQLQSIEMAICSDAQCVDMKKNVDGAMQTHVLTKKEASKTAN